MKKIQAEIRKINDKSFFLDIVTPLESDDFGVIDPFGKFPYEFKSESEIKQFIVTRLNAVGFKVTEDEIEII